MNCNGNESGLKAEKGKAVDKWCSDYAGLEKLKTKLEFTRKYTFLTTCSN